MGKKYKMCRHTLQQALFLTFILIYSSCFSVLLPLPSLILFFSILCRLIFAPSHPSFSFPAILFIFHFSLVYFPCLVPFSSQSLPACLLSFLLPPALISLSGSFSPSPPVSQCIAADSCSQLSPLLMSR